LEVRAGRGAGRDGSDKAVAAFGESFDEARVVGFVGEGVAEFVDGGVEAVFEIDEGIFGPEALLELLAGDDEAGCSKRMARIWKGRSWSLRRMPDLRSSPESRSASYAPKRISEGSWGEVVTKSPAGIDETLAQKV